MRTIPSAILGLALTLILSTVYGQQTPQPPPQRDPQAITVLAAAINASGGIPALSAIQDFTGTGKITYGAAGETQGSITIRGRGNDALRIDLTSPRGGRSWAVRSGKGSSKDEAGKLDEIPSHVATNMVALMFFQLRLLEAVNDPVVRISYVGLEEFQSGKAHHIRIERRMPKGMDLDGTLTRNTGKDLYIDATTFLVLKIEGKVFPRDNINDALPHVLTFADFRPLNGMLIPFAVEETVAGQPVCQVVLDSVQLNTGLADLVFDLN